MSKNQNNVYAEFWNSNWVWRILFVLGFLGLGIQLARGQQAPGVPELRQLLSKESFVGIARAIKDRALDWLF